MLRRVKSPVYADDATESVGLLLRLRLPWLAVGLAVGSLTTVLISRFEIVLASEVRLAFFIPIIVYLSGAVGTQTETIYVRNLGRRQIKLSAYIAKEMALGLILGAIFGSLTWLFALAWLRSAAIASTVGLAMFASISAATLIALAVASLLNKEHQDPALGAGPFTTVLQDLVGLLIYFFIASAIIL